MIGDESSTQMRSEGGGFAANIYGAMPEGKWIAGFPFFVFLTLSALPHTKKISRSARNDGAGARLHEAVRHYGWLCSWGSDGFPVFRSPHIHRFTANRKDFSLCSK